ncbi:MAG: transposase [Candidatus Acidiferrum sp.]
MSDSFSDEDLHPGHHSIRLKDHDYSGGGFYFITVCAHVKKCVFGRIVALEMQLTALGQIVRECWMGIPEHFPRVRLHGFVLMPNHLHGIIEIGCQMGRSSAAPLRPTQPRVVAGSLGAVVRSFKAAVAKRANQELRWHGQVWQRNYFERALQDGKEHADAHRYIQENILKWELDLENPENKCRKA